jgi:hypothetical protein
MIMRIMMMIFCPPLPCLLPQGHELFQQRDVCTVLVLATVTGASFLSAMFTCGGGGASEGGGRERGR